MLGPFEAILLREESLPQYFFFFVLFMAVAVRLARALRLGGPPSELPEGDNTPREHGGALGALGSALKRRWSGGCSS